MWDKVHITQVTGNLHLGFLQVIKVSQDSDEYGHTGRELKCIRCSDVETGGKHSKAKVGKHEVKKVAKIKASGGKIATPTGDVTLLVNAMLDDLEFDWV